jgi:hypothetical protein
MIRTTIAVWRVSMSRHHHFDSHLFRASDRRIEVVDFKPQQSSVTRRLQPRIADWSVVMIDIPPVKLHHEATVVQ